MSKTEFIASQPGGMEEAVARLRRIETKITKMALGERSELPTVVHSVGVGEEGVTRLDLNTPNVTLHRVREIFESEGLMGEDVDLYVRGRFFASILLGDNT